MISMPISGGLTASIVSDRFTATYTGTHQHPDVVTFYRGTQVVAVLRQTVTSDDQVTEAAVTGS